jgi:hypothetical protein
VPFDFDRPDDGESDVDGNCRRPALSKGCPNCRLPLRSLGRVLLVTSDDGLHSAVIGLCRRCTVSDRRLPEPLRGRQAAIERAFCDPASYFCAVFADPGAARLAMALLGHADYSARTLAALGWLGNECKATVQESEAPKRLRRFEVDRTGIPLS